MTTTMTFRILGGWQLFKTEVTNDEAADTDIPVYFTCAMRGITSFYDRSMKASDVIFSTSIFVFFSVSQASERLASPPVTNLGLTRLHFTHHLIPCCATCLVVLPPPLVVRQRQNMIPQIGIEGWDMFMYQHLFGHRLGHLVFDMCDFNFWNGTTLLCLFWIQCVAGHETGSRSLRFVWIM
jgi:hypothetical protein